MFRFLSQRSVWTFTPFLSHTWRSFSLSFVRFVRRSRCRVGERIRDERRRKDRRRHRRGAQRQSRQSKEGTRICIFSVVFCFSFFLLKIDLIFLFHFDSNHIIFRTTGHVQIGSENGKVRVQQSTQCHRRQFERHCPTMVKRLDGIYVRRQLSVQMDARKLLRHELNNCPLCVISCSFRFIFYCAL